MKQQKELFLSFFLRKATWHSTNVVVLILLPFKTSKPSQPGKAIPFFFSTPIGFSAWQKSVFLQVDAIFPIQLTFFSKSSAAARISSFFPEGKECV
jgi:hypothetical protein